MIYGNHRRTPRGSKCQPDDFFLCLCLAFAAFLVSLSYRNCEPVEISWSWLNRY